MANAGISEQPPAWTTGRADAMAIAPWLEFTLNRNLADYTFPTSAQEGELRATEARILDALSAAGLLSRGRYLPLAEMSLLDQHVLAERRLAVEELLTHGGPRGVFLREDQSLCVMVNGADHLSIRLVVSGYDAEAAWQELNNLDNTLSSLLDFAFEPRRGYLTSVLDNVGTGLRVRVLLHLPVLRETDRLLAHAEAAARQGLLICAAHRGGTRPVPVASDISVRAATPPPWAGEFIQAGAESALFGNAHETLGDWYMLCSHATLGRSEPELVFAAQHTASELVRAEERARTQWVTGSRLAAEDRVWRAVGAASHARLMNFEEGYTVLSALRLGAACHLLDTPSMLDLNTLVLEAQGAHLARNLTGEPTALALRTARAERFRRLFAS